MTRRVELHGHRGARGLWPENTLAGFSNAIALGVDAIEMDVAMTADGVVVVTHDAALNPDLTRGPDGAWLAGPGPLIRDLRAAELAAFDVGRLRPGTAYAKRFPDQVAVDGARIPALAEVLALDPGVWFCIETKTFPDHPDWSVDGAAMVDAVLQAADAAGVTGRIIVQSFDWQGLRKLRRARPEVAVSFLTSAATVAAARLWWDGPHPDDFSGSVPRAVAAEGGRRWGPDHETLSPALIAEAHALGLRVVPWTVNHPGDIRRLLAWGVDGLITDRPDLTRDAIAAAGFALASPRSHPDR